MVLIQDRILKIDIYNFEMSYKTPEKSLKSNQIYSVYSPFSTMSIIADTFDGELILLPRCQVSQCDDGRHTLLQHCHGHS